MRRPAAAEKEAEWVRPKISPRKNNPSNQSSNGIVFQSVILMICILIPTLTLGAGDVAPQLKLREVHSCELLSRFWRLKQPDYELRHFRLQQKIAEPSKTTVNGIEPRKASLARVERVGA